MTVPQVLIERLPSSSQLGRSITEIQLTTGGKYFTIYGADLPPYVGLDITILNPTGGNAIITLDGQKQTVPIAGLILNSIYYDQIEVVSVGSKKGSLTLYIQGISYSVIRTITKTQNVVGIDRVLG